jgi:hypothetical protein
MTKDEIMNEPMAVPYGYKYVSNSGSEIVQNPETGATYKFLEFEDIKGDGPNKMCARLLTESVVKSVPVDKETHWTVIVDIEEVPGMKSSAKNTASWIGNSFAQAVIDNGQKMEDVFSPGKTLQTELFIRIDEEGKAWNVSNSAVMRSSFEFDSNESDFLTKAAKKLAGTAETVENTQE